MPFEKEMWKALQKVSMQQKVSVEIVQNPPNKAQKVVTAETDNGEDYEFYINDSPQETTIYVYEENISGKYAGEGITLSEDESNAFITYCERFRNYAGEIISFLSDKRTK